MDKVTIQWIQTNRTNIRNENDKDFYAFSRGDTLLYIGIAYNQNVADEVNQTLRRLNISTTGLSIWLGDIDRNNSTYGRITQSIVLDAECMMIYMNNPHYNIQCKQNYTGRSNFRVISSGLNLLLSKISCDSKGNLKKK